MEYFKVGSTYIYNDRYETFRFKVINIVGDTYMNVELLTRHMIGIGLIPIEEPRKLLPLYIHHRCKLAIEQLVEDDVNSFIKG